MDAQRDMQALVVNALQQYYSERYSGSFEPTNPPAGVYLNKSGTETTNEIANSVQAEATTSANYRDTSLTQATESTSPAYESAIPTANSIEQQFALIQTLMQRNSSAPIPGNGMHLNRHPTTVPQEQHPVASLSAASFPAVVPTVARRSAQGTIVSSIQPTSRKHVRLCATTDQSRQSKKQKKPRPRRPLTAYNLFFKDERARILAEVQQEEDDVDPHTSLDTKRLRRRRPHGKVGFEEMAKTIGKRWKAISPERKAYYDAKARAEQERYREELALCLKEENEEREGLRLELEKSVSDDTKRAYFSK